MRTDTMSYVHGGSELPLIGDTLGVFFDKTVARFPDREALVVPHQACAGPIGNCSAASTTWPPA